VLYSHAPETVKTRLQLDGEGAKQGHARQYANVRDAVRQIVAREGVRGLYAGLGSALVYQTMFNGCRLGLYEPLQRLILSASSGSGGAVDPRAHWLKVVCGATSGIIGAVVASPVYLVKNRLQAESAHFRALESHGYTSLWDGLRKVWAREGARGLFRGLDGAIPRVAVGSAVQLSTYDAFRHASVEWGWASPLQQTVVASMASSLLTVTAMNPFGGWSVGAEGGGGRMGRRHRRDAACGRSRVPVPPPPAPADVVATRLYQSAGRATVYRGPLHCAAVTLRTEGALAFMRGWAPQMLRLGPHTILTFVVLEEVRRWLATVPWLSQPVPAPEEAALA
jgi:solute carrier family 25, member 34/35